VIFQNFPGPGIFKKNPGLSRRRGNPTHDVIVYKINICGSCQHVSCFFFIYSTKFSASNSLCFDQYMSYIMWLPKKQHLYYLITQSGEFIIEYQIGRSRSTAWGQALCDSKHEMKLRWHTVLAQSKNSCNQLDQHVVSPAELTNFFSGGRC